MAFERKMIILSGSGSGSVSVKVRDGRAQIKVSIFSLPYRRYYLLLRHKNGIEEYEFEGLTALVEVEERIDYDGAHFIVSDGERALLYGTNNKERMWQGNLPVRKRIEREDKTSNITPALAEERFSYTERSDLFDDIFPSGGGYADNAVASVNYYESEGLSYKNEDGEEAERVDLSEMYRDFINENSERTEPAPRTIADEQADYIRSLTDKKRANGFVEDIKNRLSRADYGDGIVLVPSLGGEERVTAKGRALTYYEQVKEKIDKLFEEGERVTELEKNLPLTKWVRVDCDGRFYIVGLIGERPDYICYGLPASYSPEPPEELGGYCQWLPVDIKNPTAKGYWLLYQSAKTGETVTRSPL